MEEYWSSALTGEIHSKTSSLLVEALLSAATTAQSPPTVIVLSLAVRRGAAARVATLLRWSMCQTFRPWAGFVGEWPAIRVGATRGGASTVSTSHGATVWGLPVLRRQPSRHRHQDLDHHLECAQRLSGGQVPSPSTAKKNSLANALRTKQFAEGVN